MVSYKNMNVFLDELTRLLSVKIEQNISKKRQVKNTTVSFPMP